MEYPAYNFIFSDFVRRSPKHSQTRKIFPINSITCVFFETRRPTGILQQKKPKFWKILTFF